MNDITPEDRADIIDCAFGRSTTINLLSKFKRENFWWIDIPHQPNNIRFAMQIALDNKDHFEKVFRFVEGKLYIYDEQQVLEEGHSWSEDFGYRGLREWYRYVYGVILEYKEISFIVDLCVRKKIILAMPKDNFDAILVMERLVESNKRNNF